MKPVQKLASSETIQQAMAAASSRVPVRFAGILSVMYFTWSGWVASTIGVRITWDSTKLQLTAHNRVTATLDDTWVQLNATADPGQLEFRGSLGGVDNSLTMAGSGPLWQLEYDVLNTSGTIISVLTNDDDADLALLDSSLAEISVTAIATEVN